MEPITRHPPPLEGRAILAQSWLNLVFLHWRVAPELVAPLLPRGTFPDTFDGDTWVGVIPFTMRRTAPLNGLVIPYVGDFTEVNVRLYAVDEQGRRGVVFLSLEASRLLAVIGARTAFSIPYFWANATTHVSGQRLIYRSTRRTGAPYRFHLDARRTHGAVRDDPLADFLTARWRLFGTRHGRTIVMHNAHPPWSLYRAEVLSLTDELAAAAGLPDVTTRPPDSVLYSPGVRTLFGAASVLRHGASE